MTKPDMSGNKSLASKTAPKDDYNISYNEDGYAIRAIKIESKTNGAAVSGANAMSDGDSDRGGYSSSVYDQEHSSNDELRSAAEVRAAAAADETIWTDARDYTERVHSSYGYPDDSNGSRYISLEMGGGGRGDGSGGFSCEVAPTHTSRYQNQVDDLTRQILNWEAFSYGPEKDPTYQQYKEGYTHNGEWTTQDTPGQVSAHTGGPVSGHTGNATQQTYDNYMGALVDKTPGLKQLAYSMYQGEDNTQRANLEILVVLEQGGYAKYADPLAQYDMDRSFDYGVHRNNISDERYNNEWNYSVGWDQIADKRYEDKTAYNRETYKDETEYNRALARVQTLAMDGDFSGYEALGYTDQEIAGPKSAYNKAQTSTHLDGGSPRDGSSDGSKSGDLSASEDVYAGMYKAGTRSGGDACAWLLSAGYNTTQAGKLAGYYADWMRNQGSNGDSGSDIQVGNRHRDSWIYIPDHGRFTYDEVKNYINSGKVIGTYDSATNTYTYK